MFKPKFRTNILLIVVGAAVAAAVTWAGLAFVGCQQTVMVGGQTLCVEVARSQDEKTQGLSHRDSLPEGHGMLFVYEEPTTPSFWMRDMNFAIDIIWVNADGQIVDVMTHITPDTYPQTFEPNQPVKYVLEVNAGFTQEHAIKAGDLVEFSL